MKYRLLAPGPTPVPDRVLAKMSLPIKHHRTPYFADVFKACQVGLKWLFQTEYDVLTTVTSGTGIFEAAFRSLLSPNDKVITIGGGKFGERWGDMAEQLGLTPIRVDVPWGQCVDVKSVAQKLKENPDVRAVVCVASETSTGVRHDYEGLGEIIAENPECIFMVDAITALGVWDISPERDNIDVLVSGSQKGMMLPPGLGFASVSDKAWTMSEGRARCAGYYLDLHKERKALAKGQSAYTSGVTLMIGLEEVLSMMQREGLQNIFERHARLARATRVGMQALNLKLLAEKPSDSVTSVWNPEGVRDDAVNKGLRDRANLTIAGGQEALKGKIFRVAHLGHYDELDVLTGLSAIEIVLKQEGYSNFTPGASIAAASPILEPGFAEGRHV